MSKIAQRQLKTLIDYNIESGVFTWKTTRHNRVNIGDIAGGRRTSVSGKTYIYIMINGRHYSAHRLAWLYINGDWPPHQIDHIDGNGENNAFSNLRCATSGENQRNRRLNSNNKTGTTGVYWWAEREKYTVSIHANGKLHSLGYFSDKTDAVIARKMAEYKYGFHENHGSVRSL